MIIIAANAAPFGAQAASVISHSQAFTVSNRVNYAASDMLTEAYRTEIVDSKRPYSGTYEGRFIAPMPRTTILLPAFDVSLGHLEAVVFSLDSRRAVTSGALGSVSRGFGAVAQLVHDAQINTSVSVGRTGIAAGSQTSRALCELVHLGGSGERTCASNIRHEQAFSGTTRLEAGHFDAAAFSSGPVAVDLFNSHVTSWLSFADTSDPAFVAVAASGLDWIGAVSVQYSYTPYAAGVPEPDAWALLIMGFGAVGAGLRRRAALSKHTVFA